MANFKLDDAIEEILEKMNRNGGNTEMIHAGSAFLQHKLQELTLNKQQKNHQEQMEYQSKSNKELLNVQTKQHDELLQQQKKRELIQTTLNVLLVIAAIASVVSAFISVQQTRQIIYQQNISERAYLVLTNPSIDKSVDGNSYELRMIVENIGVHPAIDFSFDILAFQRPFENGPKYSRTLQVLNEITSGQQPTFRESVEFLSENTPEQYFAIRMTYLDPLLERYFNSCTYLVWRGLKDGKGTTGFSHASSETSEELSKFISCET